MKNIDENEMQKRFEAISRFQLPQETVDADLERTREILRQTMNQSQVNTATLWRLIMKSKIAKISAAAIIILAVGVGISQLGESIDGAKPAWAEISIEVIEHIEIAKAITWKDTIYQKISNRDGTKIWYEATLRNMSYLAPGLYREERLDENMQIKSVSIIDSINHKALFLKPGEKTAVVHLNWTSYDSRGPFVFAKEEMENRNLEWVGTEKTAIGEANIFRATFVDNWNDEHRSYDFWVDTKTKQLVAFWNPGADIYDPEKNPPAKNLPDRAWSRTRVGSIRKEISFETELDKSLLSLEPPTDYAVETKYHTYTQVTEQEFVDYIGILTEANDKTFPDELISPGATFSRFTIQLYNNIKQKPKNERTPAEQKLIDTEIHYAEIGAIPTQFIFTDTIATSFRYLGKVVKLGDKDRIICWYQLKSTKQYRAVYGDLSVRDVDPKDLPLKVIR